MKTLLHVCCGPCASACVPELKSLGRDVTMLFANSNIDTREEFEKRKAEAEKLSRIDGVDFVSLEYDHAEWLREVADGFEHEPECAERCARCFRYNLRKAAEYARDHGFGEFTTSLTVSPLKVSAMIFAAASEVAGVRTDPAGGSVPADSAPVFLPVDFKAHGGSARSIRRAAELGLYRQNYCGCEFSKFRWRIHRKDETESTNADALAGSPGDVFTADFQTAGRGRLDHRWLSPRGTNLMMSAVLDVSGIPPDRAATFPLVAGLAVAKALEGLGSRSRTVPWLKGRIALKWPNDVLVDGRKIAGILCERHGDSVIAGIGVNVRQREFPDEIADRATSLLLATGREMKVSQVRGEVLGQLWKWYGIWRERGFDVLHQEIAALDFLKGRRIEVVQTDKDPQPLAGDCGGIRPDGTLDVGGTRVYSGEAHVSEILPLQTSRPK